MITRQAIEEKLASIPHEGLTLKIHAHQGMDGWRAVAESPSGITAVIFYRNSDDSVTGDVFTPGRRPGAIFSYIDKQYVDEWMMCCLYLWEAIKSF